MNETGHILLIEQSGPGHPGFAPALKSKGYTLHQFLTGRSALEQLATLQPHLVILNAASFSRSGMRICRQLAAALDGTPMIHIVPENSPEDVLKHGLADVILMMPFTARKLLNHVKRLHKASGQQKLKAGPVTFSPETRVVQANGKEAVLTPKAAALLSMLMGSPHAVLERSELMHAIWETDYIGDTRTLSVHIRWLREAIEHDPAKPRYLVTVRGKGYSFRPDGNAPKKARSNAAKEKSGP